MPCAAVHSNRKQGHAQLMFMLALNTSWLFKRSAICKLLMSRHPPPSLSALGGLIAEPRAPRGFCAILLPIYNNCPFFCPVARCLLPHSGSALGARQRLINFHLPFPAVQDLEAVRPAAGGRLPDAFCFWRLASASGRCWRHDYSCRRHVHVCWLFLCTCILP